MSGFKHKAKTSRLPWRARPLTRDVLSTFAIGSNIVLLD
jgi:hypothetical protein